MLVYYFVPFIVSNRYLLFWVSNGHNSVTVQNRTHVYMNFFLHKDLGNHLLQLCPKVVKHPVYMANTVRQLKTNLKNHFKINLNIQDTIWFVDNQATFAKIRWSSVGIICIKYNLQETQLKDFYCWNKVMVFKVSRLEKK